MEKDDDASRWAVAYTFQVGVKFEKKIEMSRYLISLVFRNTFINDQAG